VDARIWLGIETNYRIHQAREAEAAEAADSAAWTRSFPTKELAKRGVIHRPESDAYAFSKLL